MYRRLNVSFYIIYIYQPITVYILSQYMSNIGTRLIILLPFFFYIFLTPALVHGPLIPLSSGPRGIPWHTHVHCVRRHVRRLFTSEPCMHHTHTQYYYYQALFSCISPRRSCRLGMEAPEKNNTIHKKNGGRPLCRTTRVRAYTQTHIYNTVPVFKH